MGNHHREVIGTHARHAVRVLGQLQQPPGHLLEERVAYLSTERIVDGFEPLDVDDDERELLLLAARRAYVLRQPFEEQRAVGEAGKRIVVSQKSDLFFVFDMLEREGDIARELGQQLHFFAVEESKLARIQDKNADHHAVDHQWESSQRIDPAIQAFLLHHSLRIVLNVVRDHGPFFPDRLADQALSFRLRQGERRIVEEAAYLAVPRDRLHPHGFAVDHAHPGHAELSGPHGDAARIAEQLIPAAHAHDSRVDSAQHRVDAGELYQLSFTLAPLGDVPGDHVHAEYVARRVAGETSAPLDPPYLAARLHDPVFRFERLAYRRVFPQGHHPRPVLGMDQLAPKRAALVELLLRSAENRGRGGADVQDLTRGNRHGPYDVRQRGHDAAQPLSKRLEFLFRLAPGGSLFRFPQRPLHHRRQANEVVFQNVVGGAALERVDGGFLADRSRNEDERRVRAYIARQCERCHAVEARHRKVGQDHVRRELAQRIDERLLAIHDPVTRAQAGAPQLGQRELGVARHVFHQQNSESLCHIPLARIPPFAVALSRLIGHRPCLFLPFLTVRRSSEDTRRRGWGILPG